MKVCSKCKKEQPLENFSWYNKPKGIKASKCKSCAKAYTKKWRGNRPVELKRATSRKEYLANKDKWKARYESQKDGNSHVYILPKENYAGVTCNTYNRKANHKSVGRYVDDMRVIYSTTSREDALELEDLLHDIGYEGRHAFNSYK